MIDYFVHNVYNISIYAGPGAWNDPDQVRTLVRAVVFAILNLDLGMTEIRCEH